MPKFDPGLSRIGPETVIPLKEVSGRQSGATQANGVRGRATKYNPLHFNWLRDARAAVGAYLFVPGGTSDGQCLRMAEAVVSGFIGRPGIAAAVLKQKGRLKGRPFAKQGSLSLSQ